jgi:hypothetical protein
MVSLLYPILVNIFMVRFDKFIEKLASFDPPLREGPNKKEFNFNMNSVKISYVRFEDQ